jgi:hypothetical protein
MMKWFLNLFSRPPDTTGPSGLPLNIQTYIDAEILKGVNRVTAETERNLREELKKRLGPWDKMLVWMTTFSTAFGVLVLIASLVGVKEYLRRTVHDSFNLEMTNQIRLQFQEPHISNIIVAVASSEATNILVREVSPEITKFEASLDDKMKQVEKRLGPRIITAEQRTNLIACLNSVPKQKIHVQYSFIDAEATRFAEQITDVLTNSGFEVYSPKGLAADSYLVVGPPGLHICVKDLNKPSLAGRVQRCFLDTAIEMGGVWPQDPNFDSNRVEIVVGQK